MPPEIPPIAIRTPPPPKGFALWNLGFRPFYLLASSYAALAVLFWALQYAGAIPAARARSPRSRGVTAPGRRLPL